MKNKQKNNNGITLIALVITIVVLLILAGVTIKAIFGDNGLINRSIQARFINNFNTVSELVNIYQSQYVMQDIIDKNDGKETSNGVMLPVTTKVSDSELTKIKTNIPTLEESIKHFSNVSNISQANLYWIDLELIEANVKHKYLIDINNMQIYEYEGEYFFSKRWHVPQMGIGEGTTTSSDSEQEELFDGWITLTLYYPSDATDKMWRIGEEGETRYDGNLSWEEYTGSVTVRLNQVENIWIKYNLNGETVIIPPLGQLLVDIEVEPTGGKQEQVKVKINYDEDAETKQYRLNGGNWLDYEGEFVVTENILIEAKGVKTENVYDTEGNLITTQKVTGKDAYFIKNIGTEINENLSAPTISQNGNNVTITYPDDATKKYYTINYGPVQEYTGEIELENPDDVVTGYYETTEGSSQRASSSGDSSYEYNTTEIPQSTDVLAGPTINVSSTGTQATITLRTEKVARNIYIKLGSQSYQEYTEPVIVSSNMTISAYYVTYEDGEVSKTSYSKVTGLHQGDNPSVVIDAEPYPYGNTSTTDKVTVTITTDAESVEYSYDGIVYEIYTGSLEITSNCRIYARATNDYGTTTEYLDITNIGNTPATKKENLSVSITVTPEPKLTTTLIDSVKISISYDEKATEKYYSIGKYGTLQEYAGEFTITENCTIYAYARSSTGTGQAVKLIDNITTGIAEPVIEGNPLNSQASSKTKISIAFDKNAKTTRYEIDGSGLMDYMGEFEVYENCTIRAVNTNSLGQTSESTYTVTNIVAEAPYLLLDKGDYYLLKLPFPENSSGREYKYKADGEWISYPSDGIIFIKPEKQDQVLENGEIKIKIEDENGKEINFNGDWYLLDVPASEIFANISMRWDRIQPGEPSIILDTSEPAKEVTVSIVYPSTIVEKQYKVVYPDGTITDWQEYKTSFVIDQKGTIIYARGIDDAEVYSKEAMLTIINIDEESPVITLTADLENTQQKVGIKVAVTDDTNVSVIKWDKGNLGESHFKTSGTAISNNSIVNIDENGIYTFYAEDAAGNTQIYTLTVGNVDNTPPEITIEASPDTVGIESTITIDYGDSSIKQYKIGTNTTTWSTYSEPITLTSYDVISANAVNEDYTFTVYAKGSDDAGNEIIEEKKILNLDLDIPSTPVITSNAGYPVLTEYGVKYDAITTIQFDSRNDITNYYSVDNGETWNVYKGQSDLNTASTIIAKSVKDTTGLEAITTKTIDVPSDAIGVYAYDNEPTTYDTAKSIKKIYVDEEMIGKEVYLNYWYGSYGSNYNTYLRFYSSNNTIKEEIKYTGGARGTKAENFTIPIDTEYIAFVGNNSYPFKIYEIKTANEPKIVGTEYYPVLTEYGVKQGYNMATINYFYTSVQRLYKIDDGEWQKYENKAIRLELGQTLYAKGIDKNGKETREIPSYTSQLPSDAIGVDAYDDKPATYESVSAVKKIYVDEAIIGKDVYLNYWYGSYGSNYNTYLRFYSENNTVEKEIKYTNAASGTIAENFTIPINTKYIAFVGNNSYPFKIYEIQTANEPVIIGTKYYPEITENRVEQGYNTVIINYFRESVQRLYKIDDGEWQKYEDKAIRLELGQTLYAKGIDKEGKETRVIPSYTSQLPSDAIGVDAYDDKPSTYDSASGLKKIYVDELMIGKDVYLNYWYGSYGSNYDTYLRFYSSNNTIEKEIKYTNAANGTIAENFTIPIGTQYIAFVGNNSYPFRIYEIKPSN